MPYRKKGKKRKAKGTTREWTAKEFVDALTPVMKEQERANPVLRRVHERLRGGMLRIGLTGGLGTGKSTVARMFAECGWPVIDADAVVHQLLGAGTPTTTEVVATFGAEAQAADGSIDRARLGAIVFADAAKRMQLEAIVHPVVRAEMERQAAALAKKKAKVCLLDIPLLFESGYDWQLDAIIVVACDPITQLARCRAKFGWTDEEARRRIATQLPLTEKIKHATCVIENSGPLDATRDQVTTVAKGDVSPFAT